MKGRDRREVFDHLDKQGRVYAFYSKPQTIKVE
jgi:hypothetical protein